jgi:hypothetical protein
MTTNTRFHHRPGARTAYLRGRPASVWIDAIARHGRTEGPLHDAGDAHVD